MKKQLKILFNELEKEARALLKKVFPKDKRTIKLMKPIHTGYTNDSFYVLYDDGSEYQVRLPHCGPLINRNNEHMVLKLSGNEDFLYFDEKSGKAVKKWIKGKTPSNSNIRKNKDLQHQIFTAIKKIHALPLPKKHKFMKLDFDRYNTNLFKLKFLYQKKFLCILDRHMADPLVINHTDINALNIIVKDNGKIHFIDYEWVGLAGDMFDYANFVRESNINYEKVDWSKYIYNFDMKKFKEYIYICCVYAYLWTYAMPQTLKIIKYRRTTLKQIKKHFKGVINTDQECWVKTND